MPLDCWILGRLLDISSVLKRTDMYIDLESLTHKEALKSLRIDISPRENTNEGRPGDDRG